MNRYQRMFAGLAARGEGAFGAFVTLGDPDLATSAAILDALVESGADMIEVGIPFSDPVADGPVIQASAGRALAQGVTPSDCFALLATFRRRHNEVPVGILTYANLLVARGIETFCRDSAAAGIDSLLVADVPALEAAPFAAAARSAGIAPVLIAATNTPAPTLERIAHLSDAYVYCLSRAGVTGASAEPAFAHDHLFAALRRAGAPPPVLGFGISRTEQVAAALQAGAAGAISGSAIVERIAARPHDLAGHRAFVGAMKAATRGADRPSAERAKEAIDVRG